MGSGDKLKFGKTEGIGFGIFFSRFPFQFTVNVNFLFWYVSLGFGKGYDE